MGLDTHTNVTVIHEWDTDLLDAGIFPESLWWRGAGIVQAHVERGEGVWKGGRGGGGTEGQI